MSDNYYFTVGNLPSGRIYAVRLCEASFAQTKKFLEEFGYRQIHEQKIPIPHVNSALTLCQHFIAGEKTGEETAEALASLEQLTIAEPIELPKMTRKLAKR